MVSPSLERPRAGAQPGGGADRGGERLRVTPIVVALVAIVAATLVAGLLAARIFAGTQLPVLLAGATLGAVALTVLLRLVRAPALLALLGGLAGLAACLVGATAALHDPAKGVGDSLFDAVRNSGARILTSAIPVPPEPDTVLLPIAACWLAAAVATVLLGPLRVAPDARRRPGLAVIPPTVLLVGALILVGPNGAVSYPAVAGFAAALAVLLAAAARPWQVRAEPDPVAAAGLPAAGGDRFAIARRLAAAIVAVAVLAAAALFGGPVVARAIHRQPVDPRSYVVPPKQRLDQLNPLGMLSAWALDPHRNLLQVTTNKPARIQWATLSGFDGINWQPDRTFRAAGAVLPPPTGNDDPTTTVRQTVTVDALGGSWLPVVAAAREVHGVRVGYDADAGAVLAPDGLKPGLTYQTVSAVPRQDPDLLAAASVPPGIAQRYLTVPPGAPAELVTLAQRTAGSNGPYRKALLLERLLRTRYEYWSKAPSGNGYVTLKHFLLTKKSAGGGRGTSEQFASAFAVMGRVVGLPTRVVVGFHAGKRIGAHRYQVTSGDAFAWPEVYLAGHGWVAFDPTPVAKKGATPPDEDTPQARSEQSKKSQQLDEGAPSTAPSQPVPAPSGSSSAAAAGAGPLPPGAYGGMAAALLLALLVGAVPVLRSRRSRRRLRAGTPAQRVIGAWTEIREALRLAGHRPAAAASAAEVARLAATEVPDRPGTPPLPDLRPLAEVVNAVGFAPGVTFASADADRAAELARDYHRGLRSRHGLLSRLRWRLDPRPLFWR
jgi:transglutaminase-like putative cysteine protease